MTHYSNGYGEESYNEWLAKKTEKRNWLAADCEKKAKVNILINILETYVSLSLIKKVKGSKIPYHDIIMI